MQIKSLKRYHLTPAQYQFKTAKRNAGLEETQAGIKIAGRNVSHLRYTGDTTLMVESEEEIKSLDESGTGE